MKDMIIAAMLASGALGGPVDQDQQHLEWRIIGSNPDVYAPVFPQPTDGDYFQRTGAARSFLHPGIGVPFAILRNVEKCGRSNADWSSTVAAAAAPCAS